MLQTHSNVRGSISILRPNGTALVLALPICYGYCTVCASLRDQESDKSRRQIIEEEEELEAAPLPDSSSVFFSLTKNATQYSGTRQRGGNRHATFDTFSRYY